MYNFYFARGNKLIDYKPKFENYSRAYSKKAEFILKAGESESMRDLKINHHDEFIQCLYLGIKLVGHIKVKKEDSDQLLYVCGIFIGMIGILTPREFMNMFPIDKNYDGEKYCIKDYFSTMKMIKEYGIDNEIGYESTLGFLFDYVNSDVNDFMVQVIEALDSEAKKNGGESIWEKLIGGINTYHIRNGFLINDDTGEVEGKVEESKPKKYLSV